MKKIKSIASYVYPVTLEKRRGTINPYLEVVQFKGKHMLNAQTVNYSFGGLQLVFETLFNKIKIDRYGFKNVLILGMGGGTIISLLRDKYKKNYPITALEKDKVIIELAINYFKINAYPNLHIVCEDAFDYVSKTKEKYDLIISDLFVESNVPEVFASLNYLKCLRKIADKNCCVIYNKMTQKLFHKKEFAALCEDFELIFPGSSVHKFSIHNSENSLLYYNTLPIALPDLK